jgi:hypothetical protein
MSALADYHADPLYSTCRGMITHQLVNDWLRYPDWEMLAEDRPRTLKRKLSEWLENADIPEWKDATDASIPEFLKAYPGTDMWMIRCFRTLMKCLQRDWQLDQLMVEPQLPHYHLPNSGILNPGVPDLIGISRKFEGTLEVELKSGWGRVKPGRRKVSHYLSAGQDFCELNNLPPLRGLLWLCFASSKIDPETKWRNPADDPVVYFHWLPANLGYVDELLRHHYGVTQKDLPDLRIGSQH